MGAREPFRAKVRDRTERVANLSVIAATRPGTRPVVSTTDSFIVAMSCGLADGRQEPRHVALEASDQPILQPIGGIAKQAGFAERRYSDQLHGSDRDLRCAFVSIRMLDRPASSKYQLSTLIHPDEEMLAGVPRERRRATRAVDKSNRVERDEFLCFDSFDLGIHCDHFGAHPRSPIALRVVVPTTSPTDAAVRRQSTQWVQWTRNAFFSLETARHGPYTIPKETTP